MQFDIIIIGGGMVGATLAYTLSKGPWHIALIDATGEIREDARLIALNEGSHRLFKNIGIWADLAPYATPIQQVHISHRGHFGITRIDAQELKIDALGHVIPANNINTALFSALRNTENIKLISPATLKTLEQNSDTVTITIQTDQGIEEHTATVLIGADGNHSTVRELIGIATQKIDYQQSALVTVTELTRDHQNIAYERFQKTGAIAMLPLKGTRAATIWTAPHTQITHLMQLTDAEFLHQLQQQFGYRLGRLKQIGKRVTYPLYRQQACERKKQNVLLIGNAAHALHPIGAQGLNLPLYEVAMLSDYFLAQPSLKGCLAHLQFDNLQQKFSQSLSHHLIALFSKDFFPLSLARQIGMMGFDQCLPLKKRFAHYAMGRT